MIWRLSHRADPFASSIADRHYSRQKPGTPQFAPPGSCFVLKAGTREAGAYWVTSFPLAIWCRHAWAGAWMCSAFRNERAGKASEMIREAIAATRYHYGDPPDLGMVTFVDDSCIDRKKRHGECQCDEPNWKVRPTKVRGKLVWGWTYLKAGFVDVGETKGGLIALQLLPADMPPPEPPIGATPDMFGSAA